jgi:hypothetical protein
MADIVDTLRKHALWPDDCRVDHRADAMRSGAYAECRLSTLVITRLPTKEAPCG